MDPHAAERTKEVLLEAVTGEDGSFAFRDVRPGEYAIFCEKPPTRRQARLSVKVESGKSTECNLGLLLP